MSNLEEVKYKVYKFIYILNRYYERKEYIYIHQYEYMYQRNMKFHVCIDYTSELSKSFRLKDERQSCNDEGNLDRKSIWTDNDDTIDNPSLSI